jgi:hypothetical protein
MVHNKERLPAGKSQKSQPCCRSCSHPCVLKCFSSHPDCHAQIAAVQYFAALSLGQFRRRQQQLLVPTLVSLDETAGVLQDYQANMI